MVQHAYSPPLKAISVKAMEAERHGSARSRRYGVTSPARDSMRGIHTISIDEVDDLDDPLIDG